MTARPDCVICGRPAPAKNGACSPFCLGKLAQRTRANEAQP